MAKKAQNIVHIVTIGVFLVFVFVFALINLFGEKKEFSENENRYLAIAPELTLTNILSGDFDTEFEEWFSDHFIGRDYWIETKAAVRKAAGALENNEVYLAEDDRLVQQFLSYNPAILANNITYINEFCEDNGITANVLIVPGTAYGEKEVLPFGAYNIDQKSLLEKIAAQFTSAAFIDLSDDLASSSYYFKTDHHWNELGAYIGYKAICQNVLNKLPETFTYELVSSDFKGTMYSRSGAFWIPAEALYKIVPEDANPVTITFEDGSVMNSLYNDENLNIKDAYTYYIDGNHSIMTIDTSVHNGKKALIIKDSYAHILTPYLAQEYESLTLVDLRYYQDGVSFLLDGMSGADVYFIYELDNLTTDTNLAKLW